MTCPQLQNYVLNIARFTGYELLPSCDNVASRQHDICHLKVGMEGEKLYFKSEPQRW